MGTCDSGELRALEDDRMTHSNSEEKERNEEKLESCDEQEREYQQTRAVASPERPSERQVEEHEFDTYSIQTHAYKNVCVGDGCQWTAWNRLFLERYNKVAVVFTEIFGGGKERRTSQSSEDSCTEADNAWATFHVTYRRNFVLLATSNLFLATVVISHGAKAALARFMMKVQKTNKLFGKVREIAKSQGEVCLGPTPLSHLVGHKGDEIRTLVCGLLKSDVGEGPLTLVAALLADELFPKARHLIVKLVLMSATSWDFE